MSEEKKNRKYYLPTIILGLAVMIVFLMVIFSYQVEEGEQALVLTVGRPTAVTGPGLHFRWPLPVQEVIKYDMRKRQFSGKVGKLEETSTSDKKQVVVGISVFYRISDVQKFREANGLEAVEDILSNQMSNAKKSVIGQYKYSQLINADSRKMMLDEMKEKILALLRDDLARTCGIDVFQVVFTSIGVPEKTAEAIAGTMRQERETLAAKARESGMVKAESKRTEAREKKQIMLAQAEADAKKERAKGEANAADSYKIFDENRELAAYLQELDALRKIMGGKTTLILHTGNAPFDLFERTIYQHEQTGDKKSGDLKSTSGAVKK